MNVDEDKEKEDKNKQELDKEDKGDKDDIVDKEMDTDAQEEEKEKDEPKVSFVEVLQIPIQIYFSVQYERKFLYRKEKNKHVQKAIDIDKRVISS